MYTSYVFFFNDTATTEIYTLSLHDALPISPKRCHSPVDSWRRVFQAGRLHPEMAECRCHLRRRGHRPRHRQSTRCYGSGRSEEHTSELQSQSNLVCRLLLEKKKTSTTTHTRTTSTAPTNRLTRRLQFQVPPRDMTVLVWRFCLPRGRTVDGTM